MINLKEQQLGQNIRKSFARSQFDYPLPNLVEIQTRSYKWLLEEGLREVLQDVSPITDYSGNLIIEFIEYFLDTTIFPSTKRRNIPWRSARNGM